MISYLEMETYFLPISNFWKQELIQLGCDKHKIITHHMGIDATNFYINPPTIEHGNIIQIITVARLIEKKGVEFAICALKNLADKGYAFTYKIVGDGPLKSSLENLCNALNLTGYIQFCGPLIQSEIINLIQNADIFLLPSITAADGDMEGIPVVLMEAMAMGKLVISTYHSGVPELIKNGETGFLVSEANVQELADTIIKVNSLAIEDKKNIGFKAHEYVMKNFEITSLHKNLVAILQETISQTV